MTRLGMSSRKCVMREFLVPIMTFAPSVANPTIFCWYGTIHLAKAATVRSHLSWAVASRSWMKLKNASATCSLSNTHVCRNTCLQQLCCPINNSRKLACLEKTTHFLTFMAGDILHDDGGFCTSTCDFLRNIWICAYGCHKLRQVLHDSEWQFMLSEEDSQSYFAFAETSAFLRNLACILKACSERLLTSKSFCIRCMFLCRHMLFQFVFPCS